jgi:autotransporter family porin
MPLPPTRSLRRHPGHCASHGARDPHLGLPSFLDATTAGVRTDTGYRFGSFHRGAFIEPLATISVTWADINGFSLGGNKASFNDDPNVQGRLGLRVATSPQLWPGITMEPFVIGRGACGATFPTTIRRLGGTTFHLEDNIQDVGRGLGRK